MKVFIEGLPCVGTYSMGGEVEDRVPSLVEDDIPKGQPLTSTITTIRISRWQSDVENLRNCNFLKLS